MKHLVDAKLKLWWIPQIPMKAFEVEIVSVEEGEKLLDVLARYDAFQFENRIKPDYCNTGGIVWCHPSLTYQDWEDYPDDGDEREMLEEEFLAEASHAFP